MPGVNSPYTRLDAAQIIQNVYDEANDKLRVDSSVSVTSITGDVSVEIDAADGDNIAISDGTDTLVINPDGSINVSIVPGSTTPLVTVNSFAEITSVTAAVETTITSYTVPALKTAELVRAEFSGTNIATYNLYKNGTKIAVKRTWFNGNMSESMNFSIDTSVIGLELVAGDIITLRVIHGRPMLGDFEGRIQALEIG